MLDLNQNLKQYLLGDLSDKESEIIDLELISDDSLEEKLLIAEHEVIEEYLEGTLSQNEIELFQKNFLISPQREKLVAEIAGLKRFARKSLTKKLSPDLINNKDPGLIYKIRKFLTLQPAMGVLTIVLIGLFFGAICLTVFYESAGDNLTPLEMEYAELNKKDFNDLEKYKGYSRLNLISGSTRSFENGKNFSRENFSNKVLISLALPANVGFEEVFKVEVEQNEKVIFTQNNISTYKNPNGEELRILLPKSIFKAGDYIIRAKNNKASEIVYSFSFK
jgi:hypothetical protein